MDTDNTNEKLQTRREFFKKAAKSVLPIIGAIALVQVPITLKATQKVPMGCEGMGCEQQCRGGCVDSCYDTCRNTCSKECKDNCYDYCNGFCTDSCKDTCRETCNVTCYGSCQTSCMKLNYF